MKRYRITPVFTFLLCTFLCVCAQDEYNRRSIDDTLLFLRQKEIEIMSRIERLSVDLSVAEEKWQQARSETSAMLMAGDTGEAATHKTAAYWEHLKSIRFEVENAKLLKNWYRRHTYLRKSQLDKKIDTLNRLRFDINDLFKDADIVIAFPQRDVHIDNSKPLKVVLEDDKT